ncbi:hypothetical protein, partial [Candidatus Ichthyocystis hellenicum]|uniref:hypothetical protein n=1 Tax=Candidatus Ichthyocystis hellenicum TaxID=1561003 RepID=UPI001111E382
MNTHYNNASGSNTDGSNNSNFDSSSSCCHGHHDRNYGDASLNYASIVPTPENSSPNEDGTTNPGISSINLGKFGQNGDDIPNFDIPSIDLSEFEQNGDDIPNFDIPSIDLGEFEQNYTTNEATSSSSYESGAASSSYGLSAAP